MQRQKAVGVVIINTANNDVHEMKLDSKNMPEDNITIPSVLIDKSAWQVLAPCRDNINVTFTSEGQASVDADFTSNTALNGAMMRGMALWILFQCGVNMVRYKRRHSELSARADAIARLPVCSYTRNRTSEDAPLNAQDTSDGDEPICTVCLETLDEGDMARKLPCSHIFHQTCLDPWLAQSSSCPVCKREIPNLPPPPSHHQYGALTV
mmetsp:Transcript_27273/g.66191  ORF Transcript_27273/g.66191 Transcript_27273/m.66191 type:complete len:209 (-) Transcript_27273:31-657(-)